MAENELMPLDQDLPISNIPQDKLIKLSEKSYLPYVKLVGTGSNEAEKGIKPGNWILSRDKENFTDLTNSFECLIFAARPLACRKTMTGVDRYYDMDSQEYKDIELEAEGRDSGCWHGTEYVGWLRQVKLFFTYHAASATARGRSAELTTILTNWSATRRVAREAKAAGQPVPAVQNPQVTFKSQYIPYSNGKKQWGPVFSPATTPFSELPAWADLLEQSTKFQNPPKSSKETAQAGADAGPARG